MARAYFLTPTVPAKASQTVRLGTGVGDTYSDLENGKLTKLTAESRHVLSAVGDDIDGIITSVESATSGGFSIGGVARPVTGDMFYAVADGLQASPGVGALAINDIVVAGTATPKGTALTSFPKVCKATTPGNVVQKYRVVSLSTGAGAVGTTVVIERI